VKVGGVSRAHAIGIAAGVLLAVLFLVLRAPDAAPQSEPALPPVPDSAAHATQLGATHFGPGSDGSSVALWVKPQEWSWWFVAPHHRGCGSKDWAAEFAITRVWGPPRSERHYFDTVTWVDSIMLEGRRGSDRVRTQVAAELTPEGRVRGSHRFSFELSPL
jgi:hypothetical protein